MNEHTVTVFGGTGTREANLARFLKEKEDTKPHLSGLGGKILSRDLAIS
jgi:hypothetical protein